MTKKIIKLLTWYFYLLGVLVVLIIARLIWILLNSKNDEGTAALGATVWLFAVAFFIGYEILFFFWLDKISRQELNKIAKFQLALIFILGILGPILFALSFAGKI